MCCTKRGIYPSFSSYRLLENHLCILHWSQDTLIACSHGSLEQKMETERSTRTFSGSQCQAGEDTGIHEMLVHPITWKPAESLMSASIFSRNLYASNWRVFFLQVMYSDFRKLASQGHVKHVQIDESSGQIIFDAVFPQQKPSQKKSWIPGRRSKEIQQPAGQIFVLKCHIKDSRTTELHGFMYSVCAMACCL